MAASTRTPVSDQPPSGRRRKARERGADAPTPAEATPAEATPAEATPAEATPADADAHEDLTSGEGGAVGGPRRLTQAGTPSASQPGAHAGAQSILTRIGLAGISVVALLVFAVYAASLASRADELGEAVPIDAPGQGPAGPFGTGQAAPDVTLHTIDGQPVSLSDFAGRPVWINVWASWCAPCRAEMPDIEAVYRETRSGAGGEAADQGLVLLLVSLGEEPAVVRRYLEDTKYQLPVLVDPGYTFTNHYRVTGLPTHYFIGRDGTIRDLAIGGLKPNAMRSRLSKIL